MPGKIYHKSENTYIIYPLEVILQLCLNLINTGPVASNHGNLYNELLALMLGRYGVPHAEVNDVGRWGVERIREQEQE